MLQQKEKEIAKTFPEESLEVQERDNRESDDLEMYMKSLQERIAEDVTFLYNENCCKDSAKGIDKAFVAIVQSRQFGTLPF